jgi:hypothetical protein
MNGYPSAGLPVADTRRTGRALRNGQAVAVLGVGVRDRDHFTRLWPAPDDSIPAGFLLAMLPMRVVALAMLWATSSPRRLAVPLVLAVGFAVHLTLCRYGHDLHWADLHWHDLLAGGR